jgi:hypothetical protein
MKEKVDYGRGYSHAVLSAKIVCQSDRPAQVRGTMPGRLIWRGTTFEGDRVGAQTAEALGRASASRLCVGCRSGGYTLACPEMVDDTAWPEFLRRWRVLALRTDELGKSLSMASAPVVKTGRSSRL